MIPIGEFSIDDCRTELGLSGQQTFVSILTAMGASATNPDEANEMRGFDKDWLDAWTPITYCGWFQPSSAVLTVASPFPSNGYDVTIRVDFRSQVYTFPAQTIYWRGVDGGGSPLGGDWSGSYAITDLIGGGATPYFLRTFQDVGSPGTYPAAIQISLDNTNWVSVLSTTGP